MPENTKDYSFVGGLSSINPAEVPPEDIQKYRDVTDQGIKALEERYRNPNWFKVAAGFAKPQLGGFTASLGSAMEALGENVEQERENILPVTRMKSELELSKILLNQKNLQNQIYQNWKSSGKPMDETTLNRLTSLGDKTPVALAAQRFYDDARKRIETTGVAEELSSKYPKLEAGFKSFIDAAADPTADSATIQKRREDYDQTLNSARPPQTDPETWASMSKEQKQDAAYQYQQAQQKMGLSKEEQFRQAHDQAMPRLSTLGSIRDLALGKGLPDAVVKDENGKQVTLNGQQQMSRLLGMFGGDNPFEIIAKAANDGRLGDIFKNADSLVRQGLMTPAARREFEVLTKLLAQQNVQLRNGAVNPTNAYQEIQTAATPGVFNSQTALLSILDLMAHGERNNVKNYQYVLTKHPDARHIGADPEFYSRQQRYAEEHHKLATGVPTVNRPWFYDTNEESRRDRENEARPVTTPPAGSAVAPVAPTAPAAAIPNTSQASTTAPAIRSPNTAQRSQKIIGTNGNYYVRDKNGRWVDTGEKP